MALTAEDFRLHYESLSDEALLEIDENELVPVARECHAAEMERRSLSAVAAEAPAPPAPEAEGEAPPEPVCIVEYDHSDEAEMARGLLVAAEIPATVEHEPGVSRLMVAPDLAEQALRMLALPLSDEELAAQAEAAGLAEELAEEEAEAEEEDSA